ncbi:hypothetical protein SRHO_G00213050 [Serrasalmus rhombeus]
MRLLVRPKLRGDPAGASGRRRGCPDSRSYRSYLGTDTGAPAQVSEMSPSTPIVGTLSCILILPTLLQATSLTKLTDKASGQSVTAVSIDAARAHSFLAHSRPRRAGDPKWYHKDPNFQSYYRYYSSIGHTEGRTPTARTPPNTRTLLAFGFPKALLRLRPPSPPPPPTIPPPAPALPPHSQVDVTYLCNPKDPLCKPQIVYLPTGAVPVLCDPRYHPACKLTAAKEAPPAPVKPDTPVPPPAKKPIAHPPPPPIIVKGMEYDCDPYWDPDCLIDNPPRPVKVRSPVLALPTKAPVVQKVEKQHEEDGDSPAPEDKSTLFHDPYDYRRDLYDPYLYANPADDPQ